MALNIPMPDQPGNALNKGSAIMDRIMGRRQAQQSEDRQQQLLPYMIEKYKYDMSDADFKALLSKIQMGAMRQYYNDDGTPKNTNNISPGNENAFQGQGQSFTGSAQDNAAIGGLQEGQSYTVPGGQTPAEQRYAQNNKGLQQLLADPNTPADQKTMINQFLDKQRQQAPTQAQYQQAGQPMTAGIAQSQPAEQPQQAPQSNFAQGKESVITPGNPALSYKNVLEKPTVKVIPPTKAMPAGMIETTYPDGRVTLRKMSDSESMASGIQSSEDKLKDKIELEREKARLRQEAADKSAEAKENKAQKDTQRKLDLAKKVLGEKQGQKLTDQGKALLSTANKARELKDLLDKNPNLTGWGSGTANMLNMANSKDLGNFVETAKELQTALGRLAGSQGGSRVLKFAAGAKPSEFRDKDTNIGYIRGIVRNAKNDYNEAAKEYKEATGRDYPIKFPNIKFGDEITVRDKTTGEIREVTPEEAREMGVPNV